MCVPWGNGDVLSFSIALSCRGGFHIRPKRRERNFAFLHRVRQPRRRGVLARSCVSNSWKHSAVTTCTASRDGSAKVTAKHNLIKISLSQSLRFFGRSEALPYQYKGHRPSSWDAHTGAPLRKKGGVFRADMESAPTVLRFCFVLKPVGYHAGWPLQEKRVFR